MLSHFQRTSSLSPLHTPCHRLLSISRLLARSRVAFAIAIAFASVLAANLSQRWQPTKLSLFGYHFWACFLFPQLAASVRRLATCPKPLPKPLSLARSRRRRRPIAFAVALTSTSIKLGCPWLPSPSPLRAKVHTSTWGGFLPPVALPCAHSRPSDSANLRFAFVNVFLIRFVCRRSLGGVQFVLMCRKEEWVQSGRMKKRESEGK